MVRTGEVTGRRATVRTSRSSSLVARCTTMPLALGARWAGTISSGSAGAATPSSRHTNAAVQCESAHPGPAHNTLAHNRASGVERRGRVAEHARECAQPDAGAHASVDLRAR